MLNDNLNDLNRFEYVEPFVKDLHELEIQELLNSLHSLSQIDSKKTYEECKRLKCEHLKDFEKEKYADEILFDALDSCAYLEKTLEIYLKRIPKLLYGHSPSNHNEEYPLKHLAIYETVNALAEAKTFTGPQFLYDFTHELSVRTIVFMGQIKILSNLGQWTLEQAFDLQAEPVDLNLMQAYSIEKLEFNNPIRHKIQNYKILRCLMPSFSEQCDYYLAFNRLLKPQT